MKRIKELDGIRALAILSVLMFHDGVPLAGYLHLSWFVLRGWIGVDLFFVLSGFLITRVLLGLKNQHGYFKVFYIRRALRIWPLYYVWVIFIMLLNKHVALIGANVHAIPTWQLLLYIQNLNPGIVRIGLLSVTWSLAIEEQFYFVWPWFVHRLNPKDLAKTCMGILLLEPVLRRLAPDMRVLAPMVYLSTPFHLDGLAFGALLAIVYTSGRITSSTFKSVVWLSLCVGVIGSAMLVKPHPDSRFNGPFEFTFVGLMCAGLIGVTLGYREGLWSRMMSSKVLGVISTVSYCTYLVHQAAHKGMDNPKVRRWLLHGHTGIMAELYILILQLLLVFAVSYLSWICFESKLLGLREHLHVKKEQKVRSVPVEL